MDVWNFLSNSTISFAIGDCISFKVTDMLKKLLQVYDQFVHRQSLNEESNKSNKKNVQKRVFNTFKAP